MDCLLNPRIEHAQSTDWGNPWIGVLIKGWYPLWLNRGGLLVINTAVIVSSSVINSLGSRQTRLSCIIYGTFEL